MNWFIGLMHWTDSLAWLIGLIHCIDSLDWFIEFMLGKTNLNCNLDSEKTRGFHRWRLLPGSGKTKGFDRWHLFIILYIYISQTCTGTTEQTNKHTNKQTNTLIPSELYSLKGKCENMYLFKYIYTLMHARIPARKCPTCPRWVYTNLKSTRAKHIRGVLICE